MCQRKEDVSPINEGLYELGHERNRLINVCQSRLVLPQVSPHDPAIIKPLRLLGIQRKHAFIARQSLLDALKLQESISAIVEGPNMAGINGQGAIKKNECAWELLFGGG